MNGDKLKSNATDLAYQIACDSYEWAARRLDALDSRIQTILALGVSVTLAALLAFSTMKLDVNGRRFSLAAILFIVALGMGTFARLRGKNTIITPKVLYKEWLDFSEHEFKKNLIRFAGEHLDKNTRVIDSKQRWLVAATFTFFLEVLVLAASVVLSS